MSDNFEPIAGNSMQNQQMPNQQIPNQPTPEQSVPNQSIPNQSIPNQQVSYQQERAQEGRPEGVSFDPVTGQPIPVWQPNGQPNTNWQNTGQGRQFDPLAKPQKSQKNTWKIVLGIVAGILILFIIVIAVCIKSGIFLSPQKKILRAAVTTMEPNELMKDLDTSIFMADENYTIAFEGSVEYEGDKGTLEAAYQQNAKQKKQTFNGRFTFDGTSMDFHEYMDEEQILLSVPKIYPDAIGYNFVEEKDGYLVDMLGEEFFEALDDLCITYVNDISASKKIYTEYGEAFYNNFDALEFEKADQAVFKIDGKERKCTGYTTTITEREMDNFLNDIAVVYDKYNESQLEDLNTMCEALEIEAEQENPIDQLKKDLVDMPDIEITFYLYRSQLAAILAETEDGDGIKIEFRGGTTPTQNTIITCYDDKDEGVLQILGVTEDSVEKTKIVAQSDGEKETIATISYDYKTGDLKIKADDVNVDAKVESTKTSLKVTAEEFELDGAMVSGSVTVKKGSNITKPEQDVFDIGNASMMDFYNLGQDIENFFNDL